MAYQDIYAELSSDILDNATGSGSRHGMAKRIDLDMNSRWGKIGNVSIRTSGQEPREDEKHAEERIDHFNRIGNEKKVKFWTQRLLDAQKFNEASSKNEWVRVHMDVYEDPKFQIYVNDTKISNDALELVELLRNEKYKEFINYMKEKKGIDIVAEAIAREV